MVFEAGMVTFIRTIVIIALVYYGLKIIVKYLFPIIIKRFINKQQEKFNQQQTTNNPQSKSNNNHTSSSKKEKLGDYVDYEEVD